MSVATATKFGDLYTYQVDAKNAEEAFKMLFAHFYDKEAQLEEIDQEHKEIHFPSQSYFSFYGMPGWFARLITGEGTESDHQKKREYAERNNIDLKV